MRRFTKQGDSRSIAHQNSSTRIWLLSWPFVEFSPKLRSVRSKVFYQRPAKWSDTCYRPRLAHPFKMNSVELFFDESVASGNEIALARLSGCISCERFQNVGQKVFRTTEHYSNIDGYLRIALKLEWPRASCFWEDMSEQLKNLHFLQTGRETLPGRSDLLP